MTVHRRRATPRTALRLRCEACGHDLSVRTADGSVSVRLGNTLLRVNADWTLSAVCPSCEGVTALPFQAPGAPRACKAEPVACSLPA